MRCIVTDYTEILPSSSAVQFGVSRVIRENLKANQWQSVWAAAHWYIMQRQLVKWTAGVHSQAGKLDTERDGGHHEDTQKEQTKWERPVLLARDEV